MNVRPPPLPFALLALSACDRGLEPAPALPTSGTVALRETDFRCSVGVVEPQDGTMVALREFPNRNTIEAVYF